MKTPHGKALVFIPTYNERENVEKICSEIINAGLGLDILFLDDNSPDGTGLIIDRLAKEHQNVMVMHRNCRMGIGSAHLEGIKLAYARGYKVLITMDGDFAHSPEYLGRLIENSNECDIVVGSRYIIKNSLQGWNCMRKFLTLTGHFFTRYCLGIKYDATGALRLYRLDRIPKEVFNPVSSSGYSFFFESLYALSINGAKVREIPIILPPRIYGHSKMSFKEIFRSLKYLARIYSGALFNKNRYTMSRGRNININWDEYWEGKNSMKGAIYDITASLYRKLIMQPALNHFIKKHFKRGSKLLHAGCGSGQVDVKINKMFSITALDMSVPALDIYKRFNGDAGEIVNGDIRITPFREDTFDGIYNLGVMEHFMEKEIKVILSEFNRILRPDGKLLIFWPPSFGISVIFLKLLHLTLAKLFRSRAKLHPDEPTLVRSREHANVMFEKANFRIKEYYFGPRDLFTQVAIVAEKRY